MRPQALLVAVLFGLCAQPAVAGLACDPFTPVPAPQRPMPAPPRPTVPHLPAIRPTPMKPPVIDLDQLTEAQRERECNRRVPRDKDGGRSYEKQVAFGQCMGPKFGEGG